MRKLKLLPAFIVSVPFFLGQMDVVHPAPNAPRLERVTDGNTKGHPFTLHTLKVKAYNVPEGTTVAWDARRGRLVTQVKTDQTDDKGESDFSIRLLKHGETYTVRALLDARVLKSVSFTVTSDQTVPLTGEKKEPRLARVTAETTRGRPFTMHTLVVKAHNVPEGGGVQWMVRGRNPSGTSVGDYTDSNGEVRIRIRLGKHGETYTATATLMGTYSVSFTVTADKAAALPSNLIAISSFGIS